MKISVCLLVVITTTLDRVTWSADLVVVWPYRIHVIQLLEILCWKILTVIFGQKTVKNYIFVITPCRLKISIAHFRPKITLFVFMDDKDQNQGWSGFGQNVILWRILSSHMIYKSKVFHPNSSNFAMFLGLWVENSYVMVRSYVRVLKIVGLKIFDKTYFASRMRFACWSLRVFFSSLSFNITLFNGVGFFCLDWCCTDHDSVYQLHECWQCNNQRRPVFNTELRFDLLLLLLFLFQLLLGKCQSLPSELLQSTMVLQPLSF